MMPRANLAQFSLRKFASRKFTTCRTPSAQAISMDLRQIAMLLAFFIVYVILGGVVFMLIEAPHEMEHKELVRNSAIEFKGKSAIICI